jgi:hypothetical protein
VLQSRAFIKKPAKAKAPSAVRWPATLGSTGGFPGVDVEPPPLGDSEAELCGTVVVGAEVVGATDASCEETVCGDEGVPGCEDPLQPAAEATASTPIIQNRTRTLGILANY